MCMYQLIHLWLASACQDLLRRTLPPYMLQFQHKCNLRGVTHAWERWQCQALCSRLNRRVQNSEGPAGLLLPALCQLTQRSAALHQVHAL